MIPLEGGDQGSIKGTREEREKKNPVFQKLLGERVGFCVGVGVLAGKG